MPLRVFIDTNVLVSAVVYAGIPGRVLDAVDEGRLIGVVSLHVLEETRDVLTRPQFDFDGDTADSVVEDLARMCEVVAVESASSTWCSDPGDDPVVEAALLARVDAVVTGDAQLLRLSVPELLFITPAEVLELIERG